MMMLLMIVNDPWQIPMDCVMKVFEEAMGAVYLVNTKSSSQRVTVTSSFYRGASVSVLIMMMMMMMMMMVR
jgi:hypothetical protein